MVKPEGDRTKHDPCLNGILWAAAVSTKFPNTDILKSLISFDIRYANVSDLLSFSDLLFTFLVDKIPHSIVFQS